MDAKIRSGRKNDFDGMLTLNRNMYTESRSDPDFGDSLYFKQPSERELRGRFNKLFEEIKKGDAIYLIAEVDGSIAGQCFIRRDTPGSESSHVGILSILIDKKYRNLGVGTKLLDSAIKTSKGAFEILHLRVFASNKIAKRLYGSRGFRPFGMAPGFIKRGSKYIDREYMYLRL